MPVPREPLALTARLYRAGRVHWVDVPRSAAAPLLGAAWRIPVVLRVRGHPVRTTLVPGKSGSCRLAIKARLLDAAGLKEGDVIAFSLEPDTSSREPELPETMRLAFQKQPRLAARWAAHSALLRRQVVRYLLEADTPQTQAHRCEIFIARLAATGRLRSD